MSDQPPASGRSAVPIVPIQGERPLSTGTYLLGLLLLGLSVASSLVLVMGHIGALSIPGCGHDSPCAQAAGSFWGKVPGIGWPTSFLGFAYFVGALAAWALSRRGLSRWLLAIARLGALMSLLFLVIIVAGGYHCGYCLAAHAGNLGFWLVAESQRRRVSASLRTAGALVAVFAIVSGVLAVTEWREKAAVEQQGEAERSASVARMIAAGKEGGAPPAQASPGETPRVEPQPVPREAPPAAPPAAPAESAPPWGDAFRGRYLHGPDPAPIRIVMFTDYQCTDCNAMEEDVRKVLAERKDVSLSVMHFPMCSDCNKHFERKMHPNACWAARAAEAAGLLGGNDGFWKMHAWLFDHDGGFTDQELKAGLQELGFDSAAFIQAMTGPETLARVQSDIEEAMWVGIHYTPMIFINGVELKGFNVRGALTRTVAEVALQNPPPRTHTADHPPAALEKYVSDWRTGGLRGLGSDTHPHALGPADAPVTIVVWGDLVEPGSARADSTIRALVAARRDVRYEFRLFPANQACNPVVPRTIFENSCLAAKAAEGAGLLGGEEAYWRMHAWLMGRRERVDQAGLLAAARSQGLDPQRLLAAMERPEVAAAIEEDSRAGQQMGLTSIPLLLVNRRVVPRWEREGVSVLDRIVDLAAGARGEIPPRDEIDRAHTWNLEALYPDSAAWEADFARIDELTRPLEAMRGQLDSAAAAARLLAAQIELERLLNKLQSYAQLREDEDTGNSENQARAARIRAKVTEVSGRLAWITPELLGHSEDELRRWSDSAALRADRYEMVKLLRRKPHVLSEREETLLSRARDVFAAPHKAFSYLTDADMRFPRVADAQGVERELSQGRYLSFLLDADRRVRRDAFAAMYDTYASYKNTLAATLSHQIKLQNYLAVTRNFPSALAAALHEDNVPVELYEALIAATHAALPHFYRYVELRRRQLGLDDLDMVDVYVPIVPDYEIEVPFEQARAWVIEACAPLGEEYVRVLRSAFADRWIDALENRGKRSGAYSAGCYDSLPYVLLNYQGTLDHAFTLAHELGHSLHTWLANQSQPPRYASYPIFTAEIPSTLNEVLLLQYLLRTNDDPRFQAYLLNHYCDSFKGTVYRQAMFAEFEQRVHAMDAAGQPLTAEALGETYQALNAHYYGPAIRADERIRWEWSRIPHFYYNFYVYKYATSFCASQIFIQRVLAGQEHVTRYLDLLRGGGSDDPLALIGRAGVDLTDRATLEGAFRIFGETVDRLGDALRELT